jgi:membrane protein
MAWTTDDRVMALRRHHASIDVVIDTLDGWRRHLTGRNAWVIAFFGFMSIFPLLLAATTILGWVLEGNEELQQRIIEGAFADIPILGPQLTADPASLQGNLVALLIGLGGAIWASTRAFVAVQVAQDDVWDIPIDDRDGMPVQRGKALLAILFIGTTQIGSVVLSGAIDGAGFPIAGRLLLAAATVGINIATLLVMFRWLTAADLDWRDVWPGAVLAGVGFSVLQYFGTTLVGRFQANMSVTYGQFAFVLGLVTWLSLLSITALMCTEFNAALARRRAAISSMDPAA